jgi:hypothetical protein
MLQFCIALLTGMVAATFIPPVRKSIPKPVEVVLWIALFFFCALGLLNVSDPNARDLSASAIWASEQLINNLAGVLLGGVASWISANRYAIATWLIIVAGVDIFGLMLLGSIRSATPWRPRIRLREWMEVPVPAPAVAPRPVVADPLAGVSRRLAGASALLGAGMLVRSLAFSIRARDAVSKDRLRDGARLGAASSRAQLESLGNALAHVQFAARSWYTAAGQPAIGGVAERAAGAARSAGAVQRSLRSGRFRPSEVIDIRALLNAPSISWYGPLGPAPADSTRGDDDATDSQRPDTLAS